MARVIKIAKGVRNHWKKSIFAAAAVSYGINYAYERYEINNLMREYCAEAANYGNVRYPASQRFGKVLVVLNPMADKRSSSDTYEAYCAPILHLGGLPVDIVKTDSEGHARRYIEELETLPEIILCAGGDGTLSEIVTGLLRRSNANDISPTIGVLPVGRTNTVASNIFNYSMGSQLERVKGLADASISVVRGKTAKKDVMKIEIISNEPEEVPKKPVYALGVLEWGAYRDAYNQRDRYWYFGPLRERATFLFNAFSDSLTWNCDADIVWTEPCFGCSNCYVKPHQPPVKQQPRRWWSSLIRLGSHSSVGKTDSPDYSRVKNDRCALQNETQIHTTGVQLTTSNERPANGEDPNETDAPRLQVKLAKPNYGFDFVLASWKRLSSGVVDFDTEFAVRSIQIIPKVEVKDDEVSEEKGDTKVAEKFYSIDSEAYETKPITITLLPKLVDFYVN